MAQSIHKLWFLLFLCVSMFANAQTESFNQYYGVYLEGYQQKNLSKMKEGSELLRNKIPDEFAGFYLHSFYLLCASNNSQAQISTQQAFNLEPLSPYPYMVQSYLNFLNGDVDLARKNISYALQLRSHKSLDDIHKDIAILSHFTQKDFSTYKSILAKLISDGLMKPDLAAAFDQCFTGVFQGKSCENINELVAKFNAMPTPNPTIIQMLPLAKAVSFYSKGNLKDSENQFENFLNTTKGNEKLSWKRSYAYWFLSTLKSDNFDEQGAIVAINAALEEYKKLGFASNHLANMQLHKIHVLKSLGDRKEEKLQLAFQLEQTAKTLNNNYFLAKAYNSIGAHYLIDGAQAEIVKGGDYLSKAYNLAKNLNDQALSKEINTNYIIIKARQGLYTDADRITEETARSYLNDKMYIEAQNLYNNLAFIYFNNKNYNKATLLFEKSIALADKVKLGLNAKQKLAYMNDISGAYTGLAMSYKNTSNAEKLFQIQEQTRSGFLKEMLRADAGTATINDAQQLLKPNEILLTYTIGRPGEIIITAITKQKADVRYNYPVEDLLKFKKAYTDRNKKVPSKLNPYLADLNVDYKDGMLVSYASKEAAYTKEDFVLMVDWTRELLKTIKPELKNTRQDFLRLWYNLTLQPVSDLLAQYPNVIISSSAELNYLPFETFINPNNQYFIEKHDVKYIPSTSICKIISSRKYSENRKSVIAFGGANFQPSGNVKASVRGIEDFYKVADAVNQKITKGIYNFKPELESIGFGGADYLTGTLKEVQYVGSLANDAKVVTGYDMTESNFKKLNASGELKQYKSLLISTHGFTGDVIPEFSGVMFSQPNEGDASEDTFLLAPEILKLNLNSDLVVLSACDTGIGKIYGGEGINGLGSAFLIAGSNATMLSLWPVNDAATALTMQNLYKKTIQEKASAEKTLHQIKRSFIRGDFGEIYKQPSFWAPFLYNGI